MRYDPLQAYVAPARTSAELWRTAAGALLTLVSGFALFQLCFAIGSNLFGPAATERFVDATTFDPATPAATLFTLATFGFFGLGLAMAVHGLHGRSPRTLFGPPRMALTDFLRVSLAVGLLLAVLGLLLPRDAELVVNPMLGRRGWILLLPVSLIAILVQASTEELFFRGYLQQQLAARFPDTPLWMLAPATLFGFAHLAPASAGANAPYFVFWAVAFGMAAADLTARTGTIGAAIGLHAANNAGAILFVALAGPGSGLALYHLPVAMDADQIPLMMLPELATLFCCWLAARLVLRV
ncbi:CPBP family intramembrane glutamic endopeptidase [Tropicimonas sp. IMCC34043]|uniref:CPBP family intramembrane glutamic endopeptidase n=1 Tax=Tropicimonas sp. IMCC34043 TaxID=2248760 RepID=UPI000E25A42B|nr:CPBP family intramembrane glutamic endopeptidase [Tropicimonas sp. IMCC34043]